MLIFLTDYYSKTLGINSCIFLHIFLMGFIKKRYLRFPLNLYKKNLKKLIIQVK